MWTTATIALAAALALGATGIVEASPQRKKPAATPTAPVPGNLKAEQKRQEGKIYIDGKRLTFCVDWGKDKGWCKTNAN